MKLKLSLACLVAAGSVQAAEVNSLLAIQQVEITTIKDSMFAVGSIQQSVLTEQQFQSLMGSENWVLMDGGDCNGSKYAEVTGKIYDDCTVPDASGLFLRMVGTSGQDGKATSNGIGEYQGQATASNGLTAQTVRTGSSTTGVGGTHDHYLGYGDDIAHQGMALSVRGDGAHRSKFVSQGGAHSHSVSGGSWSTTISASSSETRPVNMAVNYFIKIN